MIPITIGEKNRFCDKLYNRVQHAEFEWLERCAKDNPETWNELINAVNTAMYDVIGETFAVSDDESLNASLNMKRLGALSSLRKVDQVARPIGGVGAWYK